MNSEKANAGPAPTGTARRMRCALLAVVLSGLVLAGCDSASDSGETGKGTPAVEDRTPAQAQAALRKILIDIATEVMPGVEPAVIDQDPVPCGGLGGTDYDRVKGGVDVGIADPKLSLTPDQLVERVQQAFTGKGWRVSTPRPSEDRYDFSAGSPDSAGVGIGYTPSKKFLQMMGETACLPNPEG